MWKYFKSSVGLNLLLIIVAAIFGYSSYAMIKRSVDLSSESRDLGRRIQDLSKKEKELDQALEEVKTAEAVEREAKSRLNLKLPGEEVVVVVEGKKDLSAMGVSTSFWNKIKGLFEPK